MLTKTPSWLICFGDHWSEYSMGSPGNIILEYTKKNSKVIWINPIPKLNLTLSKTKGNKKVFYNRILRKVKVHLAMYKKVNQGLYVFTPIYWPIVESNMGKFLNPLLYRIQIKLITIVLRVKNFAVINFTSNNIYDFIDLKKSLGFIHIAADLHSDLRLASINQRQKILETEKNIFSLADKIFPASEEITEKIIKRHGFKEKIVLLPHGVDVRHFSISSGAGSYFDGLKRPVVGYFGSLTFANDLEIYKAIADAGYTFILIGEVTGDYDILKKYSNVKFLGPIPYSQLPLYAVGFDVCIMAWTQSDWINNCNPKKTMEYLAMGKPIVSTSIPFLKTHFNEFIYFADNPNDFVNAIRIALKENNEKIVEKRINFALKNDWNEVVKKINTSMGWEF